MLESKIRKLIKLLEESDCIDEIEISSWGRKLRISKRPAENHTNSHKNSGQELSLTVTPPIQAPYTSQRPAQSPPPVEQKQRLVSIKSPMVGTFYQAPGPGAKPYVEEGQEIKAGQVVCIVEAMKLMNEIESEVAGKLVKICVANAQAVEFGQELFLVEPTS